MPAAIARAATEGISSIGSCGCDDAVSTLRELIGLKGRLDGASPAA
jgi:hypothetical protein